MNEQKIKRGLKLILLTELVLSSIPFILSMILTTNPILQVTSLLIPVFVLIYQLKSWRLI